MYARGYYVDWHTLPVVEWPTNEQHPAGTWSSDPSQDMPPFLPHHTRDAPFDFMVTKDYTEHLTQWNVRFNYFKRQRALWKDKQLYVRVVAPTDYTCSSFSCVITDHLFEDHIPRTVIISRHYLTALPDGTRNPKIKAGDIWSKPGHIAPFIHWMNRHPPGTTAFDKSLSTSNIDADINTFLDNPSWNPRHIPYAFSWIHNESVTLVGGIMVAIIIVILNITAERLMGHIRKIYVT